MAITIWLTGLPGSGKSTLARNVCARLLATGQRYWVLDGDELRKGLCADLGFSRSDRRENVRRVAETCKLLNEAGVGAVAALISPFTTDRELAKDIIGRNSFLEVWVATPLHVCEQRDPKGLYQRARQGSIPEFTGVSSPYEPPPSPSLVVHPHLASVEECVDEALALILGFEWRACNMV
ncbi:MAG: adenylyl-sulfate kinase [Burkholderiaceae bacterium]|nr:adenylyl-sulfate kinase [Roseateles sp.]MBV8468918.1 adenylyl-sulfate kinase [Burkholderiaceae bacterium]